MGTSGPSSVRALIAAAAVVTALVFVLAVAVSVVSRVAGSEGFVPLDVPDGASRRRMRYRGHGRREDTEHDIVWRKMTAGTPAPVAPQGTPAPPWTAAIWTPTSTWGPTGTPPAPPAPAPTTPAPTTPAPTTPVPSMSPQDGLFLSPTEKQHADAWFDRTSVHELLTTAYTLLTPINAFGELRVSILLLWKEGTFPSAKFYDPNVTIILKRLKETYDPWLQHLWGYNGFMAVPDGGLRVAVRAVTTRLDKIGCTRYVIWGGLVNEHFESAIDGDEGFISDPSNLDLPLFSNYAWWKRPCATKSGYSYYNSTFHHLLFSVEDEEMSVGGLTEIVNPGRPDEKSSAGISDLHHIRMPLDKGVKLENAPWTLTGMQRLAGRTLGLDTSICDDANSTVMCGATEPTHVDAYILRRVWDKIVASRMDNSALPAC